MVNYRAVSMVFVLLTVIFAATSGYLLANPTTTVSTTTVTGTTTSSAPAPTVSLTYKPGVGFYLVNSTGFTLYFRTSDVQSNMTSGCYAQCITAWPAFFASSLTLSGPFDHNDFKQVTRTDGIKQLAYYGWPLYYFAGDKKPGDTNGQGIGKVWFACCSITNSTTTSAAGTP